MSSTPVLTYAVDDKRTSRWGIVALGAALLANAVFGMDIWYANWVVGPAYDAVRKAGNDRALVEATYAHYSNLKAVAVTLFVITLGLLVIGLVAGVVGVLKKGTKRWPAVTGLALAAGVLAALAVMG